MPTSQFGPAVIDPTAQVAGEVEIGAGCEIGPGCQISGRVRLGEGVRILGPAWISGRTGPVEIGAGTVVYPYACVGAPGQDAKFKAGDPSGGVRIGAGCTLREHVTVHAATKVEAPTVVGDGVFMMACAHVGHDAHVGDGVVMVNNSCVGGHGRVGDRATMGGGAMLHQFTRIGRMSFLGGGTRQTTEVPPFCMAVERNQLTGINVIGLRRAGYPRDEITAVRRAFRTALRPSPGREEMLARLRDQALSSALVAEMAAFVAEAKRPICAGSGKPPRQMLAWLRWLTGGGTAAELAEETAD